jgi:hypothetical protein
MQLQFKRHAITATLMQRQDKCTFVLRMIMSCILFPSKRPEKKITYLKVNPQLPNTKH